MMQTTARISVDHPEEEIVMAKLIFAVLTLVAAVLMQPRSGGAAPYWPWCSQYDHPSYAHSCAFSSYEQCFQTIWGIGGYCYQNPYPPPAPARPAKQNRQTERR